MNRDRQLPNWLRFRLRADAGNKDAALKDAAPPGRLQVRYLAVLSMTAVLLAAFAALLALPTQAQTTTTTLVSNTDLTVRAGVSSAFQAQSFETGANAGGYTVSEVDIFFGDIQGRSTSVSIKENDASDEPGALVDTLTNPGTLTDNSLHTFTAPAGTTLAASTTYWITVNEGISSNRASIRAVNEDDETGETGWRIGDVRLWRTSESGSWNSTNYPLTMEIRGASGGTTLSTDATLSDFALADGSGNEITLTPPFVTGTKSYTALVANSVSSITLTPTVNDANATVDYLDASDASITDTDTSTPALDAPLAVLGNTFKVKVTAEAGGANTDTYTVVVTREEATVDTDVLVSNTAETARDGTSSFQAQRFETGASTGEFTISEVQLLLSTSTTGGKSTIVRIREDDNGEPTTGTPLATLTNPGTLTADSLNTFTAPVGTTLAASTTYWITVNEGITLDRVSFAQTQADDETGETGWSIGNRRIWRSNETDSWTKTGSFSLVIAIKGTAGGTTASADATLNGLALEDGDSNAITLTPTFASDEDEYATSVGNTVSRITVTPTVSDTNATIDYLDGGDNGLMDVDTGTEGDQFDLAVGENTIKVRVTAEDTTTALTYVVKVERAAALRTFVSNTEEEGQGVGNSNAPMAQSFITGSSAVGYEISEVSIKLKALNPDGPIVVKIKEDSNNRPGSLLTTLANPSTVTANRLNTFTAPSGTVLAANTTYWVTVNEGPSDTTGLSLVFSDDETGEAGWRIGDNILYKPIQPGDWVENNTSFTMRIRGADPAAAGAFLANLELMEVGGNAITLERSFASYEFEYEASVPNSVSRITVTPTTSDPNASFLFLDGSNSALTDVDTGTEGDQFDLAVGENTIQVRVTAADNFTTVTYTLQVTANDPATGAPVITGTAELEQTLSAGITGISDPDGTTKADGGDTGYAYTYQWERVDADGTSNPVDIAGATESTYRVIAADVGRRIRVKVSFRDDVGNPEGPLVSNALPSGGVVTCDAIWCATLYVQPLGGGDRGCGNSSPGNACSNEFHLSEDEFSHIPTNYSVTSVSVRSNGQLQLWMQPNISVGIESLVLHVGAETFAFQHADEKGERYRYWNNSGLTWSTDDAVELRLTEDTSTDPRLSDLALEDGDGNDIPLNPAFALNTVSYTASVPNATDSVTLTVTANDSNATVVITSDDDSGTLNKAELDLIVGSNTLTVTATAGDGTPKTYTITVTRAAAPATEVPATWSLVPSGLSTGDEFRLIFLSSTKRDGSATDIKTYNTFIQDRAAAGHSDIQAYSSGFRVVGCTAAADARDNTVTTGTGVPIYWLNGAQVADDYADFYDGGWDDEVNIKDEFGVAGLDTSQFDSKPMTGCKHDGTEAFDIGTSRALGSSISVRVGYPNSTVNLGPISSLASVSPSSLRPMYGISGVFQVAVGGTASTDATLSDLALEDGGGNAITLTPIFASDEDEYAAAVGNTVSQITVTPTTSDTNATIDYLDGDVHGLMDVDTGTEGDQFDLEVGENTIKVRVTAEDTTTTQTYTVQVTREGATVDTADLVVSASSVTVGEGGSRTFTVRLATQPSGGVTVAVSSDDTGAATASPASLSFTTSNWNTVQTVTVRGVDDTDTAAESVLVMLSASGGGYAGKTASVSVSVTDDDTTTPGVSVSKKVLTITEGSFGHYTLVLDSQPTGTVAVRITRLNAQVLVSPEALSFNTSNWSTPQRVTVTAIRDASTSNETVTLFHSVTSNDDSRFHTITTPSVTVNVNDTEAPNYHLRSILVPYDLALGEKALPEEEINVWAGYPFYQNMYVVAEGDRWSPSGVWADPDQDMIWVVDPIHFGIHALKLSALKDGRGRAAYRG